MKNCSDSTIRRRIVARIGETEYNRHMGLLVARCLVEPQAGVTSLMVHMNRIQDETVYYQGDVHDMLRELRIGRKYARWTVGQYALDKVGF